VRYPTAETLFHIIESNLFIVSHILARRKTRSCEKSIVNQQTQWQYPSIKGR